MFRSAQQNTSNYPTSKDVLLYPLPGNMADHVGQQLEDDTRSNQD